MDHLKTNQDRKDRWYARHIKPRYLPVEPVSLETITKTVQSAPNHNNNIDFDQSVPGIQASLLTHEEARQFLRLNLIRYGFVVIQGALNLSECNHALSLAWDYIEAASFAERKLQTNDVVDHEGDCNDEFPVKRDKHESYTSEYFPRSVEGNIYPFYGSGHSKFMWYLRSRPVVRDVFAAVHNVSRNDLATSFDGMVLWTETDVISDKGWFHVDQNPEKRPGFQSVQGLVNLLHTTPDTGGNVLVVGSHLFFPSHYVRKEGSMDDRLFYKQRLRELNGDDWLEIDPNDETLLQPINIVTSLLAPGDILIWDSRVVHCSNPPNERVMAENHPELNESFGLVRAAGLVNMLPREKISKAAQYERIEAIKSSRTLTHWVDKAAPLGEERSKEVQKEKQCVELMKLPGCRKVLCAYEESSSVECLV